MRVAIYARVSTDGQSVNSQLEALRKVARRRGWRVVKEYTDAGISGAKGRDQRPALDAMLKGAVRGEFDLVAAWSVDRLGRSLQHLVNGLSDLQAAGIGLYLHQQAIDTTTAEGKAMFGMLGVFAEFERSLPDAFSLLAHRSCSSTERASSLSGRVPHLACGAPLTRSSRGAPETPIRS